MEEEGEGNSSGAEGEWRGGGGGGSFAIAAKERQGKMRRDWRSSRRGASQEGKTEAKPPNEAAGGRQKSEAAPPRAGAGLSTAEAAGVTHTRYNPSAAPSAHLVAGAGEGGEAEALRRQFVADEQQGLVHPPRGAPLRRPPAGPGPAPVRRGFPVRLGEAGRHQQGAQRRRHRRHQPRRRRHVAALRPGAAPPPPCAAGPPTHTPPPTPPATAAVFSGVKRGGRQPGPSRLASREDEQRGQRRAWSRF